MGTKSVKYVVIVFLVFEKGTWDFLSVSCSISGDCNSVGTYSEVKMNYMMWPLSSRFRQSSHHRSSPQTWIWNRAFILPVFHTSRWSLTEREEGWVLTVTCLNREIMERTGRQERAREEWGSSPSGASCTDECREFLVGNERPSVEMATSENPPSFHWFPPIHPDLSAGF